MQDYHFRKLLEKYILGSITQEEMQVLDDFENRMKSLQIATPEIQKKKIRRTLWDGIATKMLQEKLKKIRRWYALGAAAMLVGVITISYLYFDTGKQNTSSSIDNDTITLQLEDGSILTVDEEKENEIVNSQGKIVGRQKAATLKYSNAQVNDKLVFNKLTVPYGKTFILQLSDGTTVHLNAGSSIKYPIQFIKGSKREVFITGEAYLEVTKDIEHPFLVNVSGLNIEVLGTRFNVSAYPEDETSEVVLVEGSVNLRMKQKESRVSNNIFLKPGFKGSFDKNENSIRTMAVNASAYTSWLDGKLVFKNITFENIVKKLERHYNVMIINKNTELVDDKFNANFGNESIENVLKELKANYNIDYTLLNDKILIE